MPERGRFNPRIFRGFRARREGTQPPAEPTAGPQEPQGADIVQFPGAGPADVPERRSFRAEFTESLRAVSRALFMETVDRVGTLRMRRRLGLIDMDQPPTTPELSIVPTESVQEPTQSTRSELINAGVPERLLSQTGPSGIDMAYMERLSGLARLMAKEGQVSEVVLEIAARTYLTTYSEDVGRRIAMYNANRPPEEQVDVDAMQTRLTSVQGVAEIDELATQMIAISSSDASFSERAIAMYERLDQMEAIAGPALENGEEQLPIDRAGKMAMDIHDADPSCLIENSGIYIFDDIDEPGDDIKSVRVSASNRNNHFASHEIDFTTEDMAGVVSHEHYYVDPGDGQIKLDNREPQHVQRLLEIGFREDAWTTEVDEDGRIREVLTPTGQNLTDQAERDDLESRIFTAEVGLDLPTNNEVLTMLQRLKDNTSALDDVEIPPLAEVDGLPTDETKEFFKNVVVGAATDVITYQTERREGDTIISLETSTDMEGKVLLVEQREIRQTTEQIDPDEPDELPLPALEISHWLFASGQEHVNYTQYSRIDTMNVPEDYPREELEVIREALAADYRPVIRSIGTTTNLQAGLQKMRALGEQVVGDVTTDEEVRSVQRGVADLLDVQTGVEDAVSRVETERAHDALQRDIGDMLDLEAGLRDIFSRMEEHEEPGEQGPQAAISDEQTEGGDTPNNRSGGSTGKIELEGNGGNGDQVDRGQGEEPRIGEYGEPRDQRDDRGREDPFDER